MDTDTVAVVFHHRHAATLRAAQMLCDRLHAGGLTPRPVWVTRAVAHDIAYCSGVALLSPLVLGRLHGRSLARDVASVRPTAVAAVGGTDIPWSLPRLFPASERNRFGFFVVGVAGTEPLRADIARIAEWLEERLLPAQAA